MHAATGASCERMTASTATVFIVDDDVSVRRAVGRLLRTAGFQVESFASGQEFFDQVDADRRGCIVLDVRMPGQSGFDLFGRLTSDRRNLGVIFITGHADLPSAMRAMNTSPGNFHFLLKPFEADALIVAVGQALRR